MRSSSSSAFAYMPSVNTRDGLRQNADGDVFLRGTGRFPKIIMLVAVVLVPINQINK